MQKYKLKVEKAPLVIVSDNYDSMVINQNDELVLIDYNHDKAKYILLNPKTSEVISVDNTTLKSFDWVNDDDSESLDIEIFQTPRTKRDNYLKRIAEALEKIAEK